MFENEGKRLRALLTAALTMDVDPNAFWRTLFAAAPQRFELAPLMMHEPTPRWSVWISLVAWLVREADALPPQARLDAVRVLDLWQVHMPAGGHLRAEVADVALRWIKDRRLGDLHRDVAEKYFATLRKIILRSGDVRPDAVADAMMAIAGGRHSEACRQLVAEGNARDWSESCGEPLASTCGSDRTRERRPP